MHEAPSPAPYQTNCGVALFFLAVLPRTCRLRHRIVSASTPLTDIYPVSRALLVITAGICRDEARHGRPKRGFAGFASIVDLVGRANRIDDRNKDIPFG